MKKSKIYFPSSYKGAIFKKTKSYTIRVAQEMGKYKENCIYHVFSYNEIDWKIRIKIEKVIKTKINKLTKLGIPERSLKSLRKKTSKNDNDYAELIKFSYI